MHRYKQLLVLLNVDDQDRTTIKHAQKRYQEFIDNCALRGVTVASLFRSGHDPSKIINKVVYGQGIDLVVIGARGGTNDAAVLLGSVAERVIRSSKIPLMVVKKKGSGSGLLDALLKSNGKTLKFFKSF